jgi:AmmeMemoRadiSam system protein B
MSRSTDENEHSLELHLPYIYKVLSKQFADSKDFPKLVPVLVGNTSAAKEREYGSIFAPYLQDETSIFVISSDFCHWGQRFQYTYYLPSPTTAVTEGIELRRSDAPNGDHPIHASIAVVDKACMKVIESGDFNNYRKIVDETGNTICGRHPIGIMMCAFEKLQETGHLSGESSRFEFIKYERSSDCEKLSDSSVSYASAFARAQVES